MPDQKHTTIVEEDVQGNGNQDDWEKEVVPRLPAYLEEQAKKLKAFERSREISSATDLLRGLLASVYTAHSFQQLSMWSLAGGLLESIDLLSRPHWGSQVSHCRDTFGVGALSTPGSWCPHIP